MGTVAVFRKKEGGMKKLGIWVKVKWALGSYQLRFDVSRFRNASRVDLTPLHPFDKFGVLRIPEQSAPFLHKICTKSPRILLIVVITVAQTDVMLDRGRQSNALWTLSRVRRAA
jgi:hypothetical protein